MMYANLVHADLSPGPDPEPINLEEPSPGPGAVAQGTKYTMFYHSDGRPYYADISNNNKTSWKFPYPGEKIKLTNMDFNEKSVEESLINADGDVQAAIAIIVGQ